MRAACQGCNERSLREANNVDPGRIYEREAGQMMVGVEGVLDPPPRLDLKGERAVIGISAKGIDWEDDISLCECRFHPVPDFLILERTAPV